MLKFKILLIHFIQTEKKKWTDKLTETENKWLEKMDNYKKMMDTEHREELEALTNEWTNERKVCSIIHFFQIFIYFDFSYFLFISVKCTVRKC